MRLLLDTHALAWRIVESPKLSQPARTAIAEPRNAVLASVISGYEIADKRRLVNLLPKLQRIYRGRCVMPASEPDS
jgi:PIN domain nuclease of toxin-antitoxin system